MFGKSIRVGSVWGIEVKLHVLFLVWIAFDLMGAQGDFLGALLFNGALFGSVFLHELGHCAGARWMKGSADEIILWPLGGLAMLKYPNTAKAEFVSTSAGPAVNLLLAGLAALPHGIIAVTGAASLDPTGVPWQFLYWVFVVNGGLFLFNVLPAYPMDGGRILRSMLWPLLGWRRATLGATGVAMLFGAAFVVAALFLGRGGVFLGFIGVMVVLASYREFQRAKAFRVLPKLDDDRMPHER